MPNVEQHADLRAFQGVPVLVLGASGFLGRWVARRLARSGAELHVALRDPARGSAILDRWGAHGKVHPVDLSREAEVSRILGRVEPAVAFNLAGYGVVRNERDEHASIVLNARLPEWILRSLRAGSRSDWSGMDLVHVGSALEYGAAAGDLGEATTCRPTTLYGKTKLEGTLALVRACRESAGDGPGPRAITARLFTVYGAGERSGRLFPAILQASHGPGDVALSPGTQRRDFLCAEDAAEGIVRLALSPARAGEIVNLATGNLTTVRDFALAAARLLGVGEERLRFGALPAPVDEMSHDPVSIARLRELLGWSPPADLEEGLRRALAWPGLAGASVPRRSS